ncbi:MAG TPA: GDSL-type esterase/lipase family protein [Rariglobus sp.]|nr:GDSL-type esterase/lipase family protein [Rariglobus sp.]
MKSRFISLSLLASVLLAPLAIQAQPSGGFDPKMLAQAPQGKPWEPAWGFWPKATPEAWQQTHWGFVNQAKKGGVDVLFLGDSITKGWAGAGKEIWAHTYQPLKALNIGIGGDTTRQTLWRLDNQALEGIQPKVVVLMIGVNNIFTGTGNDEEIARGIGEIITQIHAKRPAAKILLAGILPLGNEGQSARASKINGLVSAKLPSYVRFLDLTKTFRGADGKVVAEFYTADLVHLAPPGYAAWDKAMHPVLTEMLR